MSPQHFDLVSHWTLRAPLADVWDALVRTEHWPTWWPSVRAVRPLEEGDAKGIGRVVRLWWDTRLPYALTLDVRVVDVRRHERLRGQVTGTLRGEGIWLLRAEGPLTLVTYVWRVELHAAWLRLLCPVLAPVFRWNHGSVMRQGGLGLARYLRADGVSMVTLG